MQSHPMWVRGLKLILHPSTILKPWSHPMWVRGLKHTGQQSGFEVSQVAPHVGAWIETDTSYYSGVAT